MLKYTVWFAVLIVLAGAVSAQVNTIPLLAVAQNGNTTTGDVATLTLELRDGSGRVFVDTFPLTRVTTQISMRFAKQVACKEIDVDCSNFDFIYTIESDSGVVSGPSAGAAAAVLTAATLRGDYIAQNAVMTGTINSGGFVGAVGGIPEKVEAAADVGFKRVIIPQGTRSTLIEENETLEDYETLIDVDVVEAGTLSDALVVFTGRPSRRYTETIEVDRSYVDTMRQLSNQLCNRAKRLHQEPDLNQSTLELLQNLTIEADDLITQEKYYSSASLCFRSNVVARTDSYLTRFQDEEDQERLQSALLASLEEFEQTIDAAEVSTITDLQAIMIVKERLLEARASIERALLPGEDSVRQLAYSEERLASARSWATFIGQGGRALPLSDATLKESCRNKIEEAEERAIYVSSILPQRTISRNDLRQAEEYLEAGRHELCLFKAAQAKANYNVVLSAVSSNGDIDELIQTKLDIAEKTIAIAQEDEIFPIVAYSYFEYADVLRETDPSTALLFAEYALELGGFDIYFDKSETQPAPPPRTFDRTSLAIILGAVFVLGLVIGILASRRNG